MNTQTLSTDNTNVVLEVFHCVCMLALVTFHARASVRIFVVRVVRRRCRWVAHLEFGVQHNDVHISARAYSGVDSPFIK